MMALPLKAKALLLATRRDPSWDFAPNRRCVAGAVRDEATAARETARLVLEDTPLPETAQDALDIGTRLYGHIQRLGQGLAVSHPAVRCAKDAAGGRMPSGVAEARGHLRHVAQAAVDLADAVEADAAAAGAPRATYRRLPGRTLARLLAFVAAMAVVVFAATGTRDATGAAVTLSNQVLIVLIVTALALPFLLPASAPAPKATADADVPADQ